MRYAGILLMASAAVFGGFYKACVLKEQLEILVLFRRMADHLKARILHVNDSLAEALYEVGVRVQEQQTGSKRTVGEMFVRTAMRLEREQRQTFSEIWKEELEHLEVPVSKADRRNLVELGDNLGYADRSMQEQTLLFYLERTDESIAMLKEEIEVKVKLYRSLGLAAGTFLVILLI